MLALGIDFPFMIIRVILAVNHFSVLYLLCFSTVVIKSKPERHIELSQTLFAEAKERHAGAFDKLWTFCTFVPSLTSFPSHRNTLAGINRIYCPFRGSVAFPPVIFSGTGIGLSLA